MNGTCIDGYSLLSCGIDTWGTFLSEVYREMRPVNSTTCECRDFYGAVCVSWCYHGPVSGFRISSVWGIGVFEADCPTGTNVIGCHVAPDTPLNLAFDSYRQYYPSSNSACTCSDKIGTFCIATCASNIDNYEIQERTMNGTFQVVCSPSNFVLGCGMKPNNNTNYERFRIAFVVNATACQCHDLYGTTCYAICGQLNY